MKHLVTLPLFFAPALLPACSNDCACVEDCGTDADTDADAGGDTETDSDTEVACDDWVECPEPIAESCAEEPPGDLPVMLEAEQIGDGFLFAALGHQSAIGERTEGSETIITAIEWEPAEIEIGLAELSTPSASGLHPLGVDSSGGDLPTSTVAVLCDAGSCALFGADIEPGATVELVAWDGGEFPGALTNVRGLWIPPNSDEVCVFSSGIFCFDGSAWIAELPEWPEVPAFNDVENVSGQVVAVGDSGLVAISGFPEWFYWYTADGPDYQTVLFDGAYFLVGAADGTLQQPQQGSICPVADEGVFSIDLLKHVSAERISGVTAGGNIFVGRGPVCAITDLCFTGQNLGPPLAAMNDPCGISVNYMVLTADTLFGTNDCAID